MGREHSTWSVVVSRLARNAYTKKESSRDINSGTQAHARSSPCFFCSSSGNSRWSWAFFLLSNKSLTSKVGTADKMCSEWTVAASLARPLHIVLRVSSLLYHLTLPPWMTRVRSFTTHPFPVSHSPTPLFPSLSPSPTTTTTASATVCEVRE